MTRVLALCAVLTALASPVAAAQDGTSRRLKLEDLPAAMRLGVRAEIIRRTIPTRPTLVIVPDARSYVAAIGRWTTDRRFPVLIDDGTWSGREDIARFTRGFEPKEIVRWSAPADLPWPESLAERQGVIESVVAHAWGAADWAGFPQRLRVVNAPSIGVVAASMADPAWSAALALAAGHGQLIAWVQAPVPAAASTVSGEMTLADADRLSAAITDACEAGGFPWRATGDDLDAVTLCLHTPAKVRWSRARNASLGLLAPVEGEPVATTDVIGRHVDGDRLERWGWCGQVFGSEAQAAYRAMCAIFLLPTRAWVFDGYESNPPWTLFDGGEAASLLRKASIPTDVDDAPAQGAQDWRDRTAGTWWTRPPPADKGQRPVGCIDAGLIAVNTSGQNNSFDVRPGQVLVEDVPFLNVPAIVHFVHSWSAQFAAARDTLSGRWMDRGCYAYVGSVHEPYLQAFQPTPMFVKRMLAPTALGVAARQDAGPPWRIAVFGDPLITFGPPAPTSDKPLLLNGATDLRDTLRDELRGGQIEDGFANLLMSGRDADLVRLAKAMLRQEPEKVTPAAAMLALGAALRRADLEGFLAVYGVLYGEDAAMPVGAEMAWHSLRPASGSLTLDQAYLLGKRLRPASFGRDAEEVSRMVRRLGGESARREWLENMMGAATNPAHKKALDDILVGPPK